MCKFKKGDLVYFKESHNTHYISGIYELHPGPYEVLTIIADLGDSVKACLIYDIKIGKNHYISGDGYDKLITIDEWRERGLSSILNNQ